MVKGVTDTVTLSGRQCHHNLLIPAEPVTISGGNCAALGAVIPLFARIIARSRIEIFKFCIFPKSRY